MHIEESRVLEEWGIGVSELEDVDGNNRNMKLDKVRERVKMTELGIRLINEGKQKGKLISFK